MTSGRLERCTCKMRGTDWRPRCGRRRWSACASGSRWCGAYFIRKTLLVVFVAAHQWQHPGNPHSTTATMARASFLLVRVRRGSVSVMLATYNVESGIHSWHSTLQSLLHYSCSFQHVVEFIHVHRSIKLRGGSEAVGNEMAQAAPAAALWAACNTGV